MVGLPVSGGSLSLEEYRLTEVEMTLKKAHSAGQRLEILDGRD